MTTNLHCASCNRTNSDGPNDVRIISSDGVNWCRFCAAIEETPEGTEFVSQPSPGRMCEREADDCLSAWEDCYSMKPKKRILKSKAKAEIQRAWQLWEGDKSHSEAMFEFFGWLRKNRPYFLTYREKYDPWQTVHSWLIEQTSSTKTILIS